MAEVVDSTLEQRFKEAVPEIQQLISQRRRSWKLTSVMDYEDVGSIILAYIWKVFHQYDRSRPLENWANTIITTQIQNLLRDHLYKNSRPCVAATSYGYCCVYNTGGNGCKWTKENPKGSGSGIQDVSCWAYAKWDKKKRAKQAILSPVSLDDTGPQGDPTLSLYERTPSHMGYLFDVDAAKKVIDESIVRRLSEQENHVYRCLYIERLSIDETVAKLKMKKRGKRDMRSYMIVRSISLKIKEVVKQIISEQGMSQ